MTQCNVTEILDIDLDGHEVFPVDWFSIVTLSTTKKSNGTGMLLLVEGLFWDDLMHFVLIDPFVGLLAVSVFFSATIIILAFCDGRKNFKNKKQKTKKQKQKQEQHRPPSWV